MFVTSVVVVTSAKEVMLYLAFVSPLSTGRILMNFFFADGSLDAEVPINTGSHLCPGSKFRSVHLVGGLRCPNAPVFFFILLPRCMECQVMICIS